MHIATMEYPLLATAVPGDAAQIWNTTVVDGARGQPGLVRMQLYSRPGALLAIGTWEAKEGAEAFMRTGVFAVLMARLAPYLAADPTPKLWTQETFLTPQNPPLENC